MALLLAATAALPVPARAGGAALFEEGFESGTVAAWSAWVSPVPLTLSETGLYADVGSKEIAADVMEFAPRFALWSDGAVKRRWIRIPPGQTVDTTDMDLWSLPVGTRVWKEFRVGGARLETRLIERTGAGANDWLFAAYRWADDESEAGYLPGGEEDSHGTAHDIPPQSLCHACHGGVGGGGGGGLPSRVLGFGAIQLSHRGSPTTLADLAEGGWLSDPPAPATFPVPGDATARAALGYLHANCGNCHNDTIDGIFFVDLDLRLRTDQTTVETTGTYLTAVGVPPSSYFEHGVTHRIAPGDPAASGVWVRMGLRDGDEMPPVGTEVVDAAGLAAVEAWITALGAGRPRP